MRQLSACVRSSSDRQGVGPGGGLYHSVGHYVAIERGLPVTSIWIAYGAGIDSQPLAGLPQTACEKSRVVSLFPDLTAPL